MERVRGIGGIFFKAKDAPALRQWYADMLGIEVQAWGGAQFFWREDDRPDAHTVWSIFAGDTTYFGPSTAPFMLNFRVDDLDKMLAQLKAAGATVDPKVERSEFGAFGWVMDPEGNRVELWEPPKQA